MAFNSNLLFEKISDYKNISLGSLDKNDEMMMQH